MRRFQNKRKIFQPGMGDDPSDGIQSQRAAADLLVTVLVAGKRLHTVVEMDRFEPVQPHDPVKFPDNGIQIIHNIVARAINMTGIDTDTQFITPVRAYINKQ